MKVSEIKNAIAEDLFIKKLEVMATIDFLNEEIERTHTKIRRARSSKKKESYLKRVPVYKYGISDLQKNLLFIEHNISEVLK